MSAYTPVETELDDVCLLDIVACAQAIVTRCSDPACTEREWDALESVTKTHLIEVFQRVEMLIEADPLSLSDPDLRRLIAGFLGQPTHRKNSTPVAPTPRPWFRSGRVPVKAITFINGKAVPR